MKLMNSAAVLALILGGALATSASAADLRGGGLKDENPGYLSDNDAPASNWTGLWVGIGAGYNISNSELDYSQDYDGDTGHANVNGLGAEGLFGEVQVGYDQQIGDNLVLGVFGGLNLTDAEFEASIGSGGSGISLTSGFDYAGVIGPRLGFVRGNGLFYVAGGYAFAELGDAKLSGHGGVSGSESFDMPSLQGWFGEVGYEHRIRKGVRLGVAGRYTDYSEKTIYSDQYQALTIDPDVLAAMVTLKIELGGRD